MKRLEKSFLTLYVKEGRQIRQWTCDVFFDMGIGSIETTSGLRGGKATKQINEVRQGKNLGKSNETTVLEQAISDAQSKWDDKRKRGYKSLEDLGVIRLNSEAKIGIIDVYDVLNHPEPLTEFEIITTRLKEEKTTTNDAIKPMKCQKFYKEVKAGIVSTLKFPCEQGYGGQVKLNGVRALLSWNEDKAELTSKEGLKYRLPHITDGLQKSDFMYYELEAVTTYDVIDIDIENSLVTVHIYKNMIHIESLVIENETNINEYMYHYIGENYGTKTINLIYDGELYIHNTYLQDITSAVRVNSLLTSQVEYRVFDLALLNVIQSERLRMLEYKMGHAVNIVNSKITLVKTNPIYTLPQALSFMKWAKAKGYEGAIFRDMNAYYKSGGRPATIVKLKEKESAEFMIIDVIDTPNNPDVGMFVCRNNINQYEFKVVPEGTLETKKQYLRDRDKLIFCMLTVEFYERTAAPMELPLHATAIAVRNYE